ncbi:MAG: HlyC/CorC family transporter [Desulfovermiculus sp.]|nr:HlyC/CorC family transporter [Desulfovermiculus sp.]
MLTLIVAVVMALGISFLCSLTEAVLYSVNWSYIETLRQSGSKAGQRLFKLREDVDQPITAILTVNTVANTAGASVAGASAVAVFGQDSLLYFSIIFTILVLLISEIIPKTIGVMFNRGIAVFLASPLYVLVVILKPVIKAISLLVSFIHRKKQSPEHSEEDLLALASLTRRSGVLKRFEELSIQNILALDTKTVRQVMTPRTVVFSMPSHYSVSTAWDSQHLWPHSRVPIYDNDDPEDIVGIVYRREVLQALAQDQHEQKLSKLMKPVHFVLETMTLDRVLVTFLESRQHLAVVLDEYGGVAGVITLEDILEEILGNEIMDETDQVADMRELARRKRQRLQNAADKG